MYGVEWLVLQRKCKSCVMYAVYIKGKRSWFTWCQLYDCDDCIAQFQIHISNVKTYLPMIRMVLHNFLGTLDES